MLSNYPACFYPEADGQYSVIFPDLNHLSTCGATLDDAFAKAVDCLAGYLYSCRKDGEKAPPPSGLKSVDPRAEYEGCPDGAFVNMVMVDVDAYAKEHFEKSVKKTLTIPAWLNAAAQEKGINFSQTLQDALKAQLHVR
ncbi:MAG TPA: HicB family protein [Ruminococcaceae bacterium]|jgi:predicted RNase H-like HicB family nuclease|nr:HicB family protein [Oscillospiraceae bacterium]HBG56249.1 HicB family protein [Oscillospiraceae bacterium]HBQ45955.1 HicB family protein [Oscillospiraceae bacterium]HCB90469.1 HicB family protein [Oscillospiraceae bacterium]